MKCQHACLPMNQNLVLESLGYSTETISKENCSTSLAGAYSLPVLGGTACWYSLKRSFFNVFYASSHLLYLSYIKDDNCIHGIQAYTSLSVKMVRRQSEWVFIGAEGQVSWTSCGLYLPSQWTWPSCPHKNPTDSIRHSCLHPLYPFRTSFSS